MNFPITLYLIGFSGTGKYTIATEISKAGYKVVDNHLINNPIFSLLEGDGVTPIPKRAWHFISKIRSAIFDFVSEDPYSNYVFTNELCETPGDREIYRQVQEVAEKRNSLFIPVKLTISVEERRKRITNPERRLRFKSINPSELDEDKSLIHIDHPHLLEINVTHLSPCDSAVHILHHVIKMKEAS